jgi:hypothetical protein
MNLDRLVNMVINQVVRRVVNMVVNRGINFAWRKKPTSDTDAPVSDATTPAELAKDAQLRTMADQAAKAAKMARRLGR